MPAVIAVMNPSTRASGVNWIHIGRCCGTSASSAGIAAHASAIPPAAPASPSSTLSTMNCRTSRARDAPSATRTAISRVRADALTSSRLVMFAHAMSSTNPTAPISVNSTGFTLCVSRTRYGDTFTV